MPQNQTIAVRGLAPLVRDFGRASKTLRKELVAELKRVAAPVAADARARAARFGSKTASGIKPGVRTGAVYVRQQNRKVTGQRPDFGSLQMRKVLIPALEDNTALIERGVEEMLDRLTGEGFGRGGLL